MFDILNTYQYIIKCLIDELNRKDVVVKYFKENGSDAEKDITNQLLGNFND